MNPDYSKVHNRFKINNVSTDRDHLKEVAYSLVKEGDPFEKEIGDFLLDWLDHKDHVVVQTSGSTGRAKRIKLSKQSMVNSAIETGNYFGLGPGDAALMCLPARFIAGKMMLVRAIMLGLELDTIQPASTIVIAPRKKYKFCAMLPMQLQQSLKYINQFHTIIVGGAPVHPQLINAIQDSRTSIYETYGMTETITHIAVKKLNKFKSDEDKATSLFNALPNVQLSQDKHGCLMINAEHLFKGTVKTKDIVKLHSETQFEWLGRFDNIINSGGHKLNPERIEEKIASTVSSPFIVSSESDKTLGEKLILIVEGSENKIALSKIKGLSAFEKPKQVYHLPKFIRTATGKIHRKDTLKLLKTNR
ncbi:MAG: AMP-binding protein [Bacteroidia bacterium]|nr:AMP-binding protein [Bacteroidia bacterium]